MSRVILAVHGLPAEPDLVARLRDTSVVVVRRCVDAADLLACAAAEPSADVVLTLTLPRLTAASIERLAADGRVVIALAADEQQVSRAHQSPVPIVTLRAGDDAADVAREIEAALGRRQAWQNDEVDDVDDSHAAASRLARSPAEDAGRGAIVAVWGPGGAPGRTSVTIGLAEALAGRGIDVCAADADTQGPSVAFGLGLAEPAPGLLGACRRAENATMDAQALVECSRKLDRWSVLVGLEDPSRWREMRGPVLDEVWAACRSAFALTVIDVGGPVEGPDEGPWAVDRNAAGRTALAQADVLVAVADAGPLGAARLAGQWGEVRALASGARPIVLRNRVRRGQPVRWEEAIRALGVHAPVIDAGYARAGLDRCWARGRTPREARAARGWARDMARLAERVMRD